jgi:hypothetical protein
VLALYSGLLKSRTTECYGESVEYSAAVLDLKSVAHEVGAARVRDEVCGAHAACRARTRCHPDPQPQLVTVRPCKCVVLDEWLQNRADLLANV